MVDVEIKWCLARNKRVCPLKELVEQATQVPKCISHLARQIKHQIDLV